MTALNLFLDRASGAHFVTDTAAVDDRNRLVGEMNKGRALPALRAMFAINGPAQIALGFEMAVLASGLTEPGKIHESLVNLMKAASEGLERAKIHGNTMAVVVVTSWADGSPAPIAHVVANCAIPGFIAPYQPKALHGVTSAPLVYCSGLADAAEEELKRLGRDPWSHTARPEKEGLALVEMQRKHSPDLDIGSACQITSLTRSGAISTRILKRWPDKIGEPIRP